MGGFQRARRPEQVEERRQAIMAVATAMLTEMPVADISLNELSRRVGLAKSNVLRYFETREAIFLHLLEAQWMAWLAALDVALPREVDATQTVAVRIDRVAGTIAAQLAAAPLLCELSSVTSSVLERNVSTAVARWFKLAAAEATGNLAALLRVHVGELDAVSAGRLATTLFIVTAGLWPLANPGASVTAIYDDPAFAAMRIEFADELHAIVAAQLAGLLALQGAV